MFKYLTILFLVIIHFTLQAQNTIENNLKKHISTLSSYEMKGRVVGTKGSHLAADYISSQFKKNNIKPYKSSSYYQHFNTYKDSNTEQIFKIHNREISHAYYGPTPNQQRTLNLKLSHKNAISNSINKNSIVLLEPANLGDGISEALELKNKFGVNYFIFVFKPKAKSIRLYTNIQIPVKSDNYYEIKTYAKNFRHLEDYGTGLYLNKRHSNSDSNFVKALDDLHVYIVSNDIIKSTFHRKPQDFKNNTPISIEQKILHTDSVFLKNIIAKIEGKHPEKGAIIIGAHYDHVAPLPWEFKQYTFLPDSLLFMPGADDNASGTAAIIELAKEISKANHKPDRTLYFCLFDGEECGFFGSKTLEKYFKDSISLMINLDMMGRNKYNWKINEHKFFGKAEGANAELLLKQFKSQIKKNKTPLRLDQSTLFNSWKNASDHVPFRKRAEIIYFFTGHHKDYHTPFDTADKINYKKLSDFCSEFSKLLLEINF